MSKTIISSQETYAAVLLVVLSRVETWIETQIRVGNFIPYWRVKIHVQSIFKHKGSIESCCTGWYLFNETFINRKQEIILCMCVNGVEWTVLA